MATKEFVERKTEFLILGVVACVLFVLIVPHIHEVSTPSGIGLEPDSLVIAAAITGMATIIMLMVWIITGESYKIVGAKYRKKTTFEEEPNIEWVKV